MNSSCSTRLKKKVRKESAFKLCLGWCQTLYLWNWISTLFLFALGSLGLMQRAYVIHFLCIEKPVSAIIKSAGGVTAQRHKAALKDWALTLPCLQTAAQGNQESFLYLRKPKQKKGMWCLPMWLATPLKIFLPYEVWLWYTLWLLELISEIHHKYFNTASE